MSEEIRVGTANVTFHVTAFYPPMDIAQTCVDVPIIDSRIESGEWPKTNWDVGYACSDRH